MQKQKALQEYFDLRDELDKYCAELYKLHKQHLQCQAGCDQCCMDFSIFPVEYYAIKQEAGNGVKDGVALDLAGECPFLVNHRCVIYQSRPFICRTQGLPLLYMNEEQWELSVCELNFTRFGFDGFTEENTFPQDKYNSRLFLLNQKFIKALPGKPYQPVDLIPLSKLNNLSSEPDLPSQQK